MRITNGYTFDSIRANMNTTKERIDQLNTQAATLKKVNAPSDAPVGATKILEIRTDKVNNSQFVDNVRLAEAFLNNTDHALQNLSDIVLRAKEIAINQSSGASSNESTRVAVAEEVKQLYEAAVGAANTRIADRYLFGGYKTDRGPITSEGIYQGDDGQMMVEIARDVFITMNVPGLSVFNTNPRYSQDGVKIYGDREQNRTPADNERKFASQREPSSGIDEGKFGPGQDNVNLFQELQGLRISLLSGDIAGIRDTLERFDALHSKLVASRAQIGSRVAGMQGTVNALERQNITNAQLTTELEDADLAHVMTDLAREEQVFRTVLSSSQRMIQPTLLDFVKG